MARRRTTPQQQTTLGRDLAAIGLITLAFLLLASLLYAHRDAGLLLNFLSDVMQLALGVGAWALPLLCLAAGVYVGMDEPPTLSRRVIVGAVVLYLVILAMVHLASVSNANITATAVRQAGGWLGAAIGWAMARAFGDLGAYIVLAGAALAGTIMVARSTWMEFLNGLGLTVLGASEAIRSALSSVLPRREPRASGLSRSRAPGVDEYEEKVQAPSRPHHARKQPSHSGSGIFDPSEDELSSESTQTAEPERHLPIDVTPAPTASAPTAEAAPKRASSKPTDKQATARGEEPDSGDEAPVEASQWKTPSLDLLRPHPDDRVTAADAATINEQIATIEETLLNFGIPARVVDYQHGPTLTRYEVELDPGIRVAKVTQLQRELAMGLAVGSNLRIEAPIPGKRAVGIEVPNHDRRVVSLHSVVVSPGFQKHRSLLAVALGKDVAGEPIIVDLEPMPHLLVAGQTGSGKSVCLHTIIVSLLMRATPEQVRLVVIDPKRVEMPRYDSIPHLLCPVVYTLREAADVLRKCIREMQRRYDKFAVAGVSNIVEYNAEMAREAESNAKPMPRIVVIIDELADLMTRARAEFEQSICQLARLARATGIHIVAATQRPSVDVITGHIKANFAARIALRLPAQHDSRTILDSVGAERLLGDGDMLLLTSDLPKPLRVQGAFVDRSEVERLARFWQKQGEPEFYIVPDFVQDDEETGEISEEVGVGDELFASAVRYVVAEQEASVSMLQRRFKVGYARAGRLIDLMERRGIVGPHEGSRPRRVLVGPHNVEEVLSGVQPEPECELASEDKEPEEAGPNEEPQASNARG